MNTYQSYFLKEYIYIERKVLILKFEYFTAAQVRIARPTDKFEEIIDFYQNGLQLKKSANLMVIEDMME